MWTTIDNLEIVHQTSCWLCVIYDQHYNNSFHQNLESLQYNAALAITGAIRRSFKEKRYKELG